MSVRTGVVCFLLTLLASVARAQEAASPDPAALPAWMESRLTELAPANPEAYLLLGEEILDEAIDRRQTELARTLFVLAVELDRAHQGGSWVAPSACVALASMTRVEGDRRWLLAIAARLDRRYAPQALAIGLDGQQAEPPGLAAAEALGLARSGQGLRARELLADGGVRALLGEFGTLLGFTAASGAIWQVDQWAARWPCPECGNERVVFRPDTDPPSYRECYTCRGNPGPDLSTREIIDHLRLESRLLDGIHRSWAAQLAIDRGTPLRDPLPEEIAPALGVNPRLCVWRDGAWAAVDGAPATPGS